MNLSEVMHELATAAQIIPTLAGRTFHYTVPKISPPGFIVEMPESIIFDGGYARGMDKMVVPLTLVVGRVDARSSEAELAGYLAGSGQYSVKAAIDGHAYVSCDSATVTRAETAVMTFAGVSLLGALFSCDIVGRGA